MYNKLTRAGIPLRPGRKEQNTVNEIEKALETNIKELNEILQTLTDEQKQAFKAYLLKLGTSSS